MKIKKLLFINQTLGIGGAEQFGEDLLCEFQSQGIEISAYVTHPQFQKSLVKRKISTQIIPVIIDIIGDWKGLVKAVFLFPKALFVYHQIVYQNRDTSVILLSGFPEKIIVSWFASWYKIPTVWIEYGPLETVFKKFFNLPFLLYKSVIEVPKLIIVPSKNTKKDLVKHFPMISSKLEVIPCGRPEPAKYHQEVKEHQIVCVSRMEKGKGQDLLVEAFNKVLKNSPDATLVFVGQGDFEKKIKEKVSYFNIENSVSFMGRVADPLSIMAESEVCVFPSVWDLEGFGLVTIEAMSLGKSVVAFNSGPTPEIIAHNINGLLAEKGNTKNLAEQITRLFDDKKLAQKLGVQAKKDFQNTYQISTVAVKYSHAISHVLE